MDESASAQLITALRDRLAVIGDRELYQRDPAAHLQRLQEVSAQIDQLKELLPKPLDPQLAHYFQRASFAKALAFLEGERLTGEQHAE